MKKIIISSALVLSLLATFGKPLLAREATLTTTGDSTPAALSTEHYPPQPALFKFHNGNSTVYLYGSSHFIIDGVKWRTNEFNRAIGYSDRIWLESTTREMINPTLLIDQIMTMKNKDGKRVEDLLSREEMARLTKVAQSVNFDLDEYGDLHPWVISDLLEGASYHTDIKKDPKKELTLNNGVEDLIEAMGMGKPILPVENTRRHVLLFSELSPEDEKAMLMDTVTQIEQSQDEVITKFTKAWSTGDLDLMYKLDDNMRKETPGLYRILMTERNQIMFDKINKMLQGSGTEFVAVGAAHLAGPDGLVKKLEQAGYRAERIYDMEPPVASSTEREPTIPHYRTTLKIPTRLYVSLVRGRNPDEVVLHFERGLVMQGCAEVTSIKTKTMRSDDTIDLSIYGYIINIHPYPDLEGCGPATKVIQADVPLKLSELKKYKTNFLKLQTKLAFDFFTLTYDKDKKTLTLAPKSDEIGKTFKLDQKKLVLNDL